MQGARFPWLRLSGCISLALAVGMSVTACKSLPPKAAVPPAQSVELDPSSFLARLTDQLLARVPGSEESAYLAVERNAEALAWRLAVIDTVEDTLDIQTYAWHGDAAGLLLADRVLRAADRGVRVRVLVDDIHLSGGDASLVGYDSHPNIEMRLFNPMGAREGGVSSAMDFLGHFKRLNTRMHNKAIVADGKVSIVGGRNIGDEYLGLRETKNFFDVDVLALGPISIDVASSFEYYWNSDLVYPAVSFSKPEFDDRDLLGEVREALAADLAAFSSRLPSFAVEEPDWSGRFEGLGPRVSYGEARVVADEPITGRDYSEYNVIASVDELTLNAEKEVLATTPFFVPEQVTVDGVRDLVGRGVRVAALTNSLATNSQTVAHTGFKPMRKPMLEAGCEIYELRPDAEELPDIVNTPPVVAEEVGLHAKFIVIDREQVYVGSLNLDPRSIYVNTELGLLIEDPILAEQLAAIFERNASGANSWKAFLDDKGDVDWVSNLGTLEWQPANGNWQRFEARMLGLLPIKKHL